MSQLFIILIPQLLTMKYTIENLHYKTDSPLADDLVTFIFDIRFTEPGLLTVNHYHFSYSDALKQLRHDNTPLYGYITRVRRGLDCWGPAEPATLEAMGDEALQQLLDYVQQHLEQAGWIPALYEWQQQLNNKRDGAQQVHLEKILDTLDATAAAVKMNNSRSNEFKNLVQRMLRKISIEVYPEIANASGEQLRTFQLLFVNDILRTEETLLRFLKEIKEK
jgi:hypothetical protein